MSPEFTFHRELIAHVPVDTFEIVNGPTYAVWLRLKNELSQKSFVRVNFTLLTPASAKTFRRTIEVTSIYNDLEFEDEVPSRSESNFGGFFSGVRIIGVYDSNRTGFFGLDRISHTGVKAPSKTHPTPR